MPAPVFGRARPARSPCHVLGPGGVEQGSEGFRDVRGEPGISRGPEPALATFLRRLLDSPFAVPVPGIR